MTKKTIAVLLSFSIAVMPFLGFPEEIDRYFYLVAGLIVAGLVELVSIQYCSKCGQLCAPTHENLDTYHDPKSGIVEEQETVPDETVDETQDHHEMNEDSKPYTDTHAKIGGEIHRGRRYGGEE